MKTQLRDKYLLYKAKRGDTEALTKIYQLYIDKIYRFVFLKTFSKEESEDITSQVFYKIMTYLGNSERNIENLQAFLYQIARNMVIDFYRRGKDRMIELDEEMEIPVPQISPEQRLDERMDLEKVKAVLKEMNDDYRDVIILYYLEELSVKEIVLVMERSEEAIRVLIHRALKALRDKLNG